MELEQRISQARRRVDLGLSQVEALNSSRVELEQECRDLDRDFILYSKASIVLNGLAEDRQKQVQDQIESLVTKGLHAIFGPGVSFHLVTSIRANKPVIDLVIRSTLADGSSFDTDVLNARGGGMVAVVGFLLRLIILLLVKKNSPKLLVLDETFAHLSAEYRPGVAQFIRDIVDKTDTQVIMVSHFDDLTETADKVYQFNLSKYGETIIREL